ncbi:RcnB family protein [Acinetobacter shaoyimingii]|nr:RcnB family protein [Acinetobacter shaoyimingii]
MNHSNNKKIEKNIFSHQILFSLTVLAISSMISTTVMAEQKWGYRVVQQPSVPSRSTYQSYDPTAWTSNRQNADAYATPLPQSHYQNYQRPYPPYPPHHGGHGHHYPNYPAYPVQNGLTITYHQQLPSYTEYRSEQQGFVNGNNGFIQSSRMTYITDWRRYNLPAPAAGMHWIYENGRYLMVPNGR